MVAVKNDGNLFLAAGFFMTNAVEKIKEVARSWARSGRLVVPWNSESGALVPLHMATTDEDRAEELFDREKVGGIALVTGRGSGIFGILLDRESFEELENDMGMRLSDGTVSYTYGENFLIFFLPPAEGVVILEEKCLEVYGEGGYCPIFTIDKSLKRIGGASKMMPFPEVLLQKMEEISSPEEFFIQAAGAFTLARDDTDMAERICEMFFIAGKTFGNGILPEMEKILPGEIPEGNRDVFVRLARQAFERGVKDTDSCEISGKGVMFS